MKDGEWGWVWHTAKASKAGALLQKSAEGAAAKAVPAMTKALNGKPADWVPKWVEFWRVYGEANAAKPLDVVVKLGTVERRSGRDYSTLRRTMDCAAFFKLSANCQA